MKDIRCLSVTNTRRCDKCCSYCGKKDCKDRCKNSADKCGRTKEK